MADNSSNKTIAKNTLLLYFRMIVTMLITLYTSRVVLQILGVDDYGIYQAVGGIVGLLSFVNNALATGSSRFLAYGLGEGDATKLRNIFSTTLTCHVVLAVIIVIIAETAGLWFLYNKMVIPADRMDAAVYTFHLSVLTAFFTLTQVPYNATIIAHERMNIYAYVSIIDAVCKLLIVYALAIGNIDKLKLYATLLCLLQVSIILFYRYYCGRHFDEARFRLYFEKNIFKEIAGFSGWSLFAATSLALNNQGILLLLNMFFSPAVVAARAIAMQVNMAANQLVQNFQTAAVPQIVKRYANKEYDESRTLLLQTARYSFYLMLIISLPLCLAAEPILKLWLGIVPPYTVIFLQIILVQSLFQVFDTTFYYALYAKGQLRENALISPTIVFISFPIIYVLFRCGFSPVVASWASMIAFALLGFIVKPMLIIRIVDYKWNDIISVFTPCLKVTITSLPLSLSAYYFFHESNSIWLSLFLVVIISVLSVICSVWYLGIEGPMRLKMLNICKTKYKTFSGRIEV